MLHKDLSSLLSPSLRNKVLDYGSWLLKAKRERPTSRGIGQKERKKPEKKKTGGRGGEDSKQVRRYGVPSDLLSPSLPPRADLYLPCLGC